MSSPKTYRRKTLKLWHIFLVAFVLRLVPVLLTRSLGIGLDDMFQYDMLARSIAAGNGYRWYAVVDMDLIKPYVNIHLNGVDYDPVRGKETSFRAPLYPAFLSLIYSLVADEADRFFAARLAQSILGASLAILTYHVAKNMFPECVCVPRISAWIIAVYPILLVYPLGLSTENLFFPLLLVSFFLLLHTREHQSGKWYLLAGFFLGLTALTRSVILPFTALSIVWIWHFQRQKRGAIITLTALLLTIAPWIIRNSLLHQKLTGIETSMGYNLYLGYHPDGDGSFVFGPSLDLLTIFDDVERDQVGTQKAIEFIRTDPTRFLPLAINRLGFFFGLEKRGLMYFYGNNIIGYIAQPILLLLFLIILSPFVVISVSATLGVSLLRRNPRTILLGFLFVGYIFPHVIILSEDRFHLALIPFFTILAAAIWQGCISNVKMSLKESPRRKMLAVLAVLFSILLILNWGFEISRDADKIIQLLGPDGNLSYFPY